MADKKPPKGSSDPKQSNPKQLIYWYINRCKSTSFAIAGAQENGQKFESKFQIRQTLIYENYKIYVSVLLLIIIYSIIFLFLNLLTPYDTALLLEINQYRIAAIESFFVLWTNGGTYLFMSLIVIVLWLKGEKNPAIYLALGLIIDAILVSDLKIMIHRPRPYEVLPIMPLEIAENLRSLPSGHTATALLSATILSKFYSKYAVVLFVIAASIGLSRVYIGVHYPLDVIVGAITGYLVGIIMVDILDRFGVGKRL